MDFRNVLRECPAKLISTTDCLVETSSGTETQTTGVTNSVVSLPVVAANTSMTSGTRVTSTIAPSGMALHSSVIDEHRRIFGFRPSVGGFQR